MGLGAKRGEEGQKGGREEVGGGGGREEWRKGGGGGVEGRERCVESRGPVHLIL